MPGTELFGEEERREVMEVLDTGVLFRYGHEDRRRGRWKARQMEKMVSDYTGASHALAVSSGSTAVACALAAAGIGYGDEVIVPPFTYLATIEAVLLAGGLPVFADIDDTLCLDAASVRAALTPNTRAVLLVHMCGAAADMDPLLDLCRERDLVLVEDAGQALGAWYHGRSVGRFGATGAYSFDFFKITTAGEGGVFVTDDETRYRLADSYADHGHVHAGENRGMEAHPIVGFNYRISELHAAVGLAQMRKLDQIRSAKRENKARLREAVEDLPGIGFRRMPDPEGDSGTFLNLLLPDRRLASAAVDALRKSDVPGVNYWYTNMYHFINQWDHVKDLAAAAPLAIHALGAPQDYRALELPGAQDVIGRLVSIGVGCGWNAEETARTSRNLRTALASVLGGEA
ncbi:MAG: DegT/DnrJ/EryC1/StrS family aminotransferase [Gemmatimonadota bacterium]